jgi:transposase
VAWLAKGRLRAKLGDLRLAMVGRFGEHHRVMLRVQLDHIDHLDAAIVALDERVDELMAPFVKLRDLLDSITGVGPRAAEVIIAEIGVDMGVFVSAAHLASWAGLCPGNNESAGKRRSGKTRKGDTWLRAMLVECAWSAGRSRDTYLSAQFWRIAKRRGKERAAVAVAHSILVIVYHVLATGQPYQDLGGDYFTRRQDPQTRTRQLVAQLEKLGHKVTLEPAA